MEARKRLSDFDFSKQGCHISLVNKEVGYAANGKPALVLKALSPAGDVNDKENQVSEMIEKSAVEVMVQKAVEDAVAPLQEVIKAKEAEIESFKVAQKQTIVKSRKEALDNVVGTEKSEELMSVCENMDDQAFSVIVKSLGEAVKTQAESDMFVEKGVAGEADTSAVKSFADYLPKKK